MDATDRLLDESGPWAAGLIGDEAAMAALRAALAARGGTTWRQGEHGVLRAALAAGLDLGKPLRTQTYRLASVAAGPAAAPAPARSAGPPRAAPAPVASGPVPGELTPDLDAGAMAQALLEASRDGAPFCEECARAAAAQHA